MNEHILNLITQLLAYSDPSVTDNPHQRAFDHTRRLQSIPIKNPYGNAVSIAPGGSFTIFDGTTATGLNGSSVISLQLLSAPDSIYRLLITSGPSGFKTARAPTGLGACVVTINNNAVAQFDFTAATLTGVVAGDIMRVKGAALYDTGSFAFNPINAGLWKIIAVSGTKVSAVRLVGEPFAGLAESVASGADTDVQFYADDGIQKGDKFDVTETLSVVSRRTYEVLDASPTTIDFVSAIPLPLESALTYIADSITFYKSSKKLIYIEVDQDAVVRFNDDTSDTNRLTPIEPSNKDLPGFLNKWGDTYRCTIVNKSISQMNVKFFMGE